MQITETQLRYWRELLLDAPTHLELPTDRMRRTSRERSQILRLSLARELPSPMLQELKELARREGVTLLVVCVAAYQALLSRWSGQADIVVGVSVAKRSDPENKKPVEGPSKTLPVRVHVPAERPFRQLLARVNAAVLDAYAHQDLPFEVIAAELSKERDLTRQPLFQVALALDDDTSESLELPELEQGSGIEPSTADLELALFLHQDSASHGLSLTFEYAADLFDKETIECLAACFQTLLVAIVEDPDATVEHLPLLTAVEKQRLLESNVATAPYPKDKLIHELYEEQAARTPNAIAAAYGKQMLTYAELNGRANQLARYLRDKGVGPDRLVGICIERSLDMVIALLATLKAGGAYLPLDPNYPAERVQYMLEDAAPTVVLTQTSLRQMLPATRTDTVVLEDCRDEIAKLNDANLGFEASVVLATHLAYVIYTSGSTGRPKGVMIEHRSVVNLWQSLENIYRRSRPCQRVALNAPINFDASVQQLVQLLSGRSLFVVPQDVRRDASALIDFVFDNDIDAIDCTPSQLKIWISAGLFAAPRNHLRVVLVGGEAIDPELWNALAQCAGTDFYNVYGPTECTVDAMAAHVTHDAKGPHIGRPMENRRVYVLDRLGQPVPIGVSGEMYIGGIGVARGYLNRPELTSERFGTDPFNAIPGARMYRTGDFGRWRRDGKLEYLGRGDDQVKIRGYRIELGEIESHLARHEQVKESAVIVREDAPGERRLVAYIISRNQLTPRPEELRTYLMRVLPEYMVPSAFVVLEKLPLMPNGKLNRRELPAPRMEAASGENYERPRGEVEELLAGMWQEVLRVERVARQDNFFDLGGDSLAAMRLVGRIRAVFSISFHAHLVFRKPVFQTLAQSVESLLTDRSAPNQETTIATL